MRRLLFSCAAALGALLWGHGTSCSAISLLHKQPKKTTSELRAEYLVRVGQEMMASPQRPAPGSLWSPGGVLVDPGADYKAHSLNDIVTVLASVQTTAAQSGSVDSERNFSTNATASATSGSATSAGANPSLSASSSTALKGSGATNSSTAFATSLTGQVIAVLANGNVVIEAHRQIDMNNQHEEVVVRGIARPGDISPVNTVASSSLSSLEIELKGKGIISDSVRSPNPLTRAILWILGF
jgi:flagellar L-ring protein FlgH